MTEESFSPRRVAKRFLVAIVVIGVAATVVLTIFQRDLLFPVYAIPAIEKQEPSNAETWFTKTEHPVEVWFLRGDGSDTKKPVVFFAHGNGGLIDHFPSALRPYRELGFHVVLVEYRGYGRSKGSPNQDDIVADITTVYDQIVQRSDVDASRVLFHGQSIGGGVIAAVAKNRPPTRLIMESTFTSVRDIAYDLLPPFWLLVFDPFDSLAVLETLSVPVLIMHGKKDQIIPFSHAKTLAAVSKHATFISFQAAHMLPWNETYWSHIKTFVRPLRN